MDEPDIPCAPVPLRIEGVGDGMDSPGDRESTVRAGRLFHPGEEFEQDAASAGTGEEVVGAGRRLR